MKMHLISGICLIALAAICPLTAKATYVLKWHTEGGALPGVVGLPSPSGGQMQPTACESIGSLDGSGPQLVTYSGGLDLRILDGASGQVLFTQNINPQGGGCGYSYLVLLRDMDRDGYPDVVLSTSCGVWVIGWQGATSSPQGQGAESPRPPAVSMGQPIPNPLARSTSIPLVTEESGRVALRVYDASGSLVRTFPPSVMSAGRHKLLWDARDDAGLDVPSGQYFCQLEINGAVVGSRRAVVLK